MYIVHFQLLHDLSDFKFAFCDSTRHIQVLVATGRCAVDLLFLYYNQLLQLYKYEVPVATLYSEQAAALVEHAC